MDLVLFINAETSLNCRQILSQFHCNSQKSRLFRERERASMASSRVWNGLLGFVLCVFVLSSASICAASEAEPETETEKDYVLTLDHSNFSDTVSKHEFIVVEFYAPWCGHCKNLAPEYEKAASVLSSHDPPIILAKVDANEEVNKEIASQYEVQGFPTIKILRNGGKTVQEYKGPREADGIVAYLKKQVGPPSAELKSAEDASSLIDEKKISVVGVFPKFSGEEFENFMALADKLRSEYAFSHTLDAKLLPRGESQVTGPTLRLLKPFDELSVDFQNFQVEAMEKFLEEASTPLVTEFIQDPDNHPYLVKFFESSNAKAMLFMDFSNELTDAFKSKLKDVANLYKGKGVSFLVGDVEPSKAAIEYFGLKDDQLPVILIQNNKGLKFLKSNVEPDHISPWLKEYMDGNIKPFIKSEPIPVVNDEPVKVVVTDSLKDMVLDSKKNVLLEFYAPWCGHCKKLAPILDEVAVSFENDDAVMIAKLDATANDVVDDTFDVQGYPTLYFKSASGKVLPYDGDRTKEDIIDFIQNNRDDSAKLNIAETAKDEL